MRFVMFMIPRVYQPDTPPGEKAGEGFAPPAETVARMMKFNEELANAGALIALDGLHPVSKGARVAFAGGKTQVTGGPFTEAKEVIGGYWMIEAKSREEAVGWARRCPASDGDVIEVRQVFEMSDFPQDVRKAADNPAVRSGRKTQSVMTHSIRREPYAENHPVPVVRRQSRRGGEILCFHIPRFETGRIKRHREIVNRKGIDICPVPI